MLLNILLLISASINLLGGIAIVLLLKSVIKNQTPF
jgi:hypothetical protein